MTQYDWLILALTTASSWFAQSIEYAYHTSRSTLYSMESLFEDGNLIFQDSSSFQKEYAPKQQSLRQGRS